MLKNDVEECVTKKKRDAKISITQNGSEDFSLN